MKRLAIWVRINLGRFASSNAPKIEAAKAAPRIRDSGKMEMSRMEHRSNEAREHVEDENRRHGLKHLGVPVSRDLGDAGGRGMGWGKLAKSGGQAPVPC